MLSTVTIRQCVSKMLEQSSEMCLPSPLSKKSVYVRKYLVFEIQPPRSPDFICEGDTQKAPVYSAPTSTTHL